MGNIKRPPAVWVTQVLLVVFTLLMLSVLLLDAAMLLTRRGELPSLFPLLIVFAIIFAIILLFASSFWGLTKAKPFGRWLGVSSMVLVWGVILVAQLRRPSGPFKYYEYDNTTQLVSGIVAQLLLDSLFLILILRLAFARRVGEFFDQRANKQQDRPERVSLKLMD
jgi:hypothetical protein